MLSLPCLKTYFRANWRFAVLALLFCLFFSRLGFWQLMRADEKKEMLATQERFAMDAPVDWQSGDALPKQYQPIQVQGNFLPVTLLLDNQHHQHQLGYDVLSPLVLANGKIVLIDRGWIPSESDRTTLPSVTALNAKRAVSGSVYYPSQKSWLLGSVFDKKQGNIAVIELIDARILSQFLHKSVYPFIIRMNPAAEDGFVREWAVVSMPPERHLAYAVQWFALALLVVILFVVLTMKKKT